MCKLPKRTQIFTVRVVYKSGYTHDFDVYEFSYTTGKCTWTAVSDSNKPILLGMDEIAAIYQVGVRTVWRFRAK